MAASLLPLSLAMSKGVAPSLVVALTAAPLARSALTVSVWPSNVAMCRAVQPSLLILTLTAAPASRRALTVSVCPLCGKG